jgi:hypothetical protein
MESLEIVTYEVLSMILSRDDYLLHDPQTPPTFENNVL